MISPIRKCVNFLGKFTNETRAKTVGRKLQTEIHWKVTETIPSRNEGLLSDGDSGPADAEFGFSRPADAEFVFSPLISWPGRAR